MWGQAVVRALFQPDLPFCGSLYQSANGSRIRPSGSSPCRCRSAVALYTYPDARRANRSHPPANHIWRPLAARIIPHQPTCRYQMAPRVAQTSVYVPEFGFPLIIPQATFHGPRAPGESLTGHRIVHS